MLLPDSAEKNPLSYSVESSNRSFRVTFVCSYTAVVVSAIRAPKSENHFRCQKEKCFKINAVKFLKVSFTPTKDIVNSGLLTCAMHWRVVVRHTCISLYTTRAPHKRAQHWKVPRGRKRDIRTT